MDIYELPGKDFFFNYLKNREEQDGEGIGGCGVHLSSQIHQEYTFRHRKSCRTPAESRHALHVQQYMTTGK